VAVGGGWRYLLLLAAGCVVAAAAPMLPGWWAVVTGFVLAFFGLAWPSTRPFALFLLGGLWFLVHAQWQMDRNWPAERSGETLLISGSVIGLTEQREQGIRFEFRPDRGQSDADLPSRVLVNWFRPSEYVEPGSRWQLELQLRPPAGRDNPAGFDYQRYLLSRRIGAVATVRGDFERLDAGRGTQVDRLRQRLATVLQAETTRLDAAALKRALGLADRSAMKPELSDLLRRTGTAHLLAISGLHVGMVAAIGALLCTVVLAPIVTVQRRFDRRRLALAGGLVAATAYAMLAGFTLPTQRALIMIGVIALACFLRRAIAPAHALLLALVAVLLFDPLAPLATGFWLSFAAVAVLVWAFAWRPAPGQSRGQWLTGLLRAQLVIAVGLLPLNVGVFQQLVPAAFFANLVAIPLVGLWILPALLLEMAGIALGLSTALVSSAGEQGLVWLVGLLAWFDGFDFSHARVAGGSWKIVLPAAAGALWLLAPRGWPARWLGLPLLLPLLVPRPDVLREGELELWLLDAGDGLAALVRSDAELLLYDTGPGDGQGGDMIGRELDDLLARLGIKSIDGLVVSHAHRGHAGGLGSVQHRVPPERVYSSVEGLGHRCTAGEEWSAGTYRFRFLHPSAGLPDLGANSSCVLHIEGPGGAVLLTGGIDASVEARLVQQFAGPPADVLVLSAGGHRRASSEEFLRAVSPRIALASVQQYDRFGRPHPEAVSSVDAVGAALVSTGQCGALRVRLGEGHPVQIRSMATLQPRFWKARSACP
jgi:competence protein ComEC